MSLSGLLDITQPQDLLKGLINTLQEYEQSREDSDKHKIVRLAPTNGSSLTSEHSDPPNACSGRKWVSDRACSPTTWDPTAMPPKLI